MSNNKSDQPVTTFQSVIVLEKEFKYNKGHKGDIKCMCKTTETEFVTCSDDMSIKMWDRDLQGCIYTYETPEPCHNMRMTGEKNNLLILSLGSGSFVVLGLEKVNQHHIFENAHDS